MRVAGAIAVAVLAAAALTQPAAARAPDEETAVMAPINALVAGVTARDATAVLAAIRPDGEATIVTDGADGRPILRHPTWPQFVAGIKPGPEKFEPRLKHPIVKVDGDIAMAWTPYVFLVDGKVHHCGVNHFDLVRENGAWKILNVTYTIRTTGCGQG